MSADLFAEFGFGPAPTQRPDGSRQGKAESQTNSLIPGLETSEDTLSTGSSDRLNRHQFQTAGQSVHAGRSTTTSESNITRPLDEISRERDDNVLFDATLETFPGDGDDDWGEFESAETLPEHSQPTGLTSKLNNSVLPRHERSTPSKGSGVLPSPINLIDSLSIEDEVSWTRSQSMSAVAKTDPKSSKKSSLVSTGPSAESTDEFFDEWGDFLGGQPTEVSSREARKSKPCEEFADDKREPIQNKTLPVQAEKNTRRAQSQSEDRASTTRIRPTNIPPPSVLLQLFPRLFEQLQQEASRLRGNPEQKAALEDIASLISCTLKVAARVVAGRTLRWKRDSILSQSMRIGPARAGKSGGMKLNTVNKTENIKERQEALDLVGMWRDRAGFFNSIMLSSGKRPIQVIADNVRVITAGPEKGALKALHACALCGLKRDERLPGKIDENVEDSFGEWWTDHWGHTDCRQFWEKNIELLDQR